MLSTIYSLKISMHRLEFKEIRTQICLLICEDQFVKEQILLFWIQCIQSHHKEKSYHRAFRNLMLELGKSLNILLSTLEQN